MTRSDDQIFVRNFMVIIGLLVAVTIGLMILAASLYEVDPSIQQQLVQQRTARYLQPVGAVRLSGEPMPKVASAEQSAASSGPRGGKQVVQQVCGACHNGNFMNAPQIGNKKQWKPHLDTGLSKLVGHVSNGYQNMPAQGNAASNDEIRKAILYMVQDQTGLKLSKKE